MSETKHTHDDRCKFSTYGYACGKPVEHGRYLCDEHAASKCSSCGQPATHGCDFCGQFVCGAPLCDECTYDTDETKPSGAWGFMNHIHISKPEFADKHENRRLKKEVTAMRDTSIKNAQERNSAESLVADLLALAYQYRDDLRHPPSPDSRERRLAAIEAALVKAGA